MNLSEFEHFEGINGIEKIMQEEVGRNLGEMFQYSKGWLYNVANTLANAESANVGLMTGFYIPRGTPPSAETDGPLGAAMLMQFFEKIGFRCRLMTDELCRGACAAAMTEAKVKGPLDVVTHGNTKTFYRKWKNSGITHALSIERCGRSVSGPPRNMRGTDICSYTISFDALYRDGPWKKLAIGDGGNEIGMGLVPKQTIARNIANGDNIACVTPSDKNCLIVAGVSNWGAYALIATMSLLKPEWVEAALEVLSEKNNTRILSAMVSDGPSVDGVSGEQKLSVDGMPLEKHNAVVASMREVILTYSNVPVRGLERENREFSLLDIAHGPS